MPHVVGILDNARQAHEAFAELVSLGLTKDDISLIMSEKTRKRFAATTDNPNDAAIKTADEGTDRRALVDSAIGAGAGGILGASLATMAMAGVILVPGVSLLAGGPLIALLTGTGAGAAVGGLAGALSAYGISGGESARYADEIKAGKAILIAHTKNQAQKHVARFVLMNQGAGIRAA